MTQINLIEVYDGTKFNSFDVEYCTTFLNNNEDTIFYNIALFNKSSRNRYNNDAFDTVQILGGSGKYNGATENVYIYVDSVGTRYIKIIKIIIKSIFVKIYQCI